MDKFHLLCVRGNALHEALTVGFVSTVKMVLISVAPPQGEAVAPHAAAHQGVTRPRAFLPFYVCPHSTAVISHGQS